jgi:hypothetical protein
MPVREVTGDEGALFMSTQSSKVPSRPVPVAKPASPALGIVAEDEEAVEASWFSADSLKGWGTSFTVHVLLLIGMAFWIFVPKSNPPRSFDSRLAGSDMGVDEGMAASGGLNTPIEMSASPTPAPEPVMTTLAPINLESLGPKIAEQAGAEKASAGGGMNNNNPGAGNGDGFGLARFGQGGENIRGVAVKVGDPQFTLLWDSEADLDLHVIEPGGKEIYWEDPKGTKGGELDVDNTKGFGPENIYWLRAVEGSNEKVLGPGPPGDYKWFVHYWGGFGGIPRATRWKVRIKHDGQVQIVTGRFKALNERSKTYTLKVEPKGTETVEESSSK